jgi:cell division protein FtsQ
MDERIKERRREVGRSRGRRRLAVLVGAVTIVLIAVALVWLGSSDVFAVRYVSVPVGEHVPVGALRTVLAPASGHNLLRISTSDLEEALSAIPWVKAAKVYRRFPDSLEVTLEEHSPVAEVRDPEGVDWLLAEDGTVLEQVDPTALPLPRIVVEGDIRPRAGGVVPTRVVEGIPLALRLQNGELWAVEAMPVDFISVGAAGDMVVRLAGGGEIRLGDTDDLEEKFTVAHEIIDLYLKEGKELEYVDVTVPSRPVAKAR